MKTVVFVALFVALFAYAQAAATFSINAGATTITNSYVSGRHTDPLNPSNGFVAAFTVNVVCDGTNFENCTTGGGTWSIPNGITGVSIDTTADPDQVNVDPSANPPEKFKITFTAINTTSGGASLVHDLFIFVTDATVYNGAPAIAGKWVATKITNTPSRNLQWTPSNDPSFDPTASPYNFVRPVQPNPTIGVPLYWGNFYEIRLGLAEDNGRYCGTNGTWPDQTNDDDVPPTPSTTGWNPAGCANFLENTDTWTFPAPSQRVPRAGSSGYDTQRPQSAANPITAATGPLVWSVRGGAGSALKFAGLALPSNYVSTCVDPVNGNPNPSFPCIAPRFNPDPQVWVVSATGAQPARITAVGTSSVTLPTISALNHQATPPIDLGDIRNTNEFLVNFEWPNIQTAVTGDATAGIPAQPIVINRPTCAATGSFVADDPANPVASNVKGINWFPTCEQGLMTSTCTPGGTVTNCLNATFAANDADTVVTSLLGQVALQGIWISQRPLQILPNGASAAFLNTGSGSAKAVPLTFDARQGTLPFTIGFPLDVTLSGSTGNAVVDNYWNFGANGSTNAGVVTIKPKLVIECANTVDCLSTTGGTQNYVPGSLTDFFGATVPTLTVSNANPSATVAFSSLPQPTQGNTWVMFFEVQDAATSTTVYPYTSIPYIVITLTDIDISFVNFPPVDHNFWITQPQANAPNSYVYQVRIKRSPRSLGLASITLGWTITGATAPITILVNGTAVTQFVFSEYQTVINFQVFTAGAPVGPFTITWTDPLAANGGNSFLTIPAPSVDLFVRANPISPKTVSLRTAGPFVGEPFWVELTWSPPATTAFTVTASGASIAEATASVTASVGDTGMILGPLTPILPSNIDLSVTSFQLPISLRTDSTAYSIVSVVTVNVFRHSLVVTNSIDSGTSQNDTLILWTNGEASQQYCISTNYPVFNSSLVTASDSLTITLASDSATPNVPGLLFTPAVVVLSSATPRACVTIKADRNFNWDSILTAGTTLEYAVNAYLGGSLAGMFQNPTGSGIGDTENVWDLPQTVIVSRLNEALTVELDQSRLTGQEDTYALGETVQLRVYTDVLPVAGLNYTIRAPGGITIVPSTAGSSSTTSHGRFAPATAGAPGQWQAWDVTFTGFAGDSQTTSTFARQATLSLYVSSGDAEFYRSSLPNPLLGVVASVTTVNIVKRRVVLNPFSSATVQLSSLVGGSTSGLVALDHPVVNGLTVSLSTATTNGVSSGGLSFSPANLTFTAGGANSQAFTVKGNLLGTYMLRASLSGPDADWFDLDDVSSAPQFITVTKRTGPVVGLASGAVFGTEGTVYAGLTYGPIGVDFPSPLNLGESVTITPTGSDFTFTPASVTLTAGQSQALFSFVFKSATKVNKAVVFWQFSGPDAWKYDYTAPGQSLRQSFDVSYLSWEVNYGTGSVIPGVTHEGWVTLPFPVATDLTITPFVLGASISFNPAVWSFTPATGNTLHFTYTVNGAQAFGLSTSGVFVSSGAKRDFVQPEVSNVGIRVVYLVNGTDAAAYSTAGTDSISVSRPTFKLDATYQQDQASFSKVVQNAAEQTTLGDWSKSGNLFVVGKWSQWYTVHLATPPAAGSVTVTITDSQNVVHFQVGSDTNEPTSATLTFTADTYAQHFRFRFVKLLASDSTVSGIARLSVSVSGTNAAWYDYTEIFNAFNGIQVVPPLAFSPIPAIYTDGHADGLFVALKNPDGAFGAWPFADDAQFTLHIFPSPKSGVVVEPSTLEFSKSQANTPVQGFSIRHTNPRVFSGLRSYTLKYYVRFAGQTDVVDITAIVPQDAQHVLLSRHQIIPKFPHVLSYGWQKASFNLSHIPLGHVSFIPRLPPVDGGSFSSSVRGATTPAGRVDFEPAVIVAAPGQQIVDFQIKAQPGVDRENLYYRVDWEVIGHADDTVNWIESLQNGASGLANSENIYFATWHLASASVAQVSLVVMFVACIFLAVMNLN